MIEKKIHYIWFGKNPLSPLALKCIESWKKYCPDYEIIEWNESNFDINSNQYVKEAYENKKWAFVSDYVRLYVLYYYGGIYMDTDVEVLSSLDPYLKNKAFSGFEKAEQVPTGIMASEKNHPFFKKLLDYYNDRPFIKEDGSLDLTTNVTTITNYFLEEGLELNNQLQTVADVTLYPNDYFCPKDCVTGKINLTKNTVTIHHFDGSWVPQKNKVKAKIQKILGKRITSIIVSIKKSFTNEKYIH